MFLWCNRKGGHNVRELIKEMISWQQQGYLDRAIWQSKLFASNALSFQKSFSEENQCGMLSYEESKIFEDLGLEKTFWVPKMFEILRNNNLKDLKDIGNHMVMDYLERRRDMNSSQRDKLVSLFAELKCLYFPPFKTESITDLPKSLMKRKEHFLNNRDDDDEAKFKDLIHELESTIWNWGKSPKLSFEYLVCIATLCLFGFDVDVSFFTIIPNENQLETLSTMLNENLKDLTVFQKIEEKQAYVLNIAMSDAFGNTKVIPYLLKKIPDTVPKELSIFSFGEKDLSELKKTINSILNRKDDKAYKNTEKFLSMYFQSIFSQKVPTTTMENNTIAIAEPFKHFLEKLGLLQHYPNKLTHADVMKLSEDALKDVNKKPSTLPELPWYFMRKMLSLDSTVRERGSAVKMQLENLEDTEESEESMEPGESQESKGDSDSSLTDSEDEESKEVDGENENAIHPLDLIYAVFMCADDFLRQELVEKMSKCQYAVPLILPSPDGNGIESQSQILHWGLQTISKTYWEGNSSVTKTMVNVDCPLVSCLHLGDNVPWKLKILNEILGDNLNNFWHEALEGGDRIQKFSEGMVEVSWYLPGGRKTDRFNTPVTFANLRADATKYKLVTEKLSRLSTITCIFTHTTKNIRTFLKETFNKGWSKRVIVVILYKPDDKDEIQRRLKKLRKKLKLKEHEIISYPFEENQFFNTHAKLLETLQASFNNKTDNGESLSSLVNELKSVMKVDDKKCHDGHTAAQSILRGIDEIESKQPHGVKSEILPCQSDTVTREKIGKHDKETCRYRDITAKEDIEQYSSRKREEKWQLQWQQLHHPMSQTFVNFLKYIVTFNSFSRKYFLRSLKLGLNERSAEILQPLYEEYEKCLRERESVERRKELNEQMAKSSLGLEHFFREMAVMYENMMALRKKNGKKESQLDSILNTLTQCMADILLDGEAIELLDGDVAHSHVLWLTAVINEIENRKLIRIFKVSVLGSQSCGKSTLLNTMFGLNFPVSTGRCTRGAYMQLVKIDENLAKQLHCDYLLVIDSEGLMSRVSKNEDYDNELATFVIGLSDLTLVVIKGEGKEMEDVLPIAIHVFLRMNVLGELQACHFVHQNIGAVDAGQKLLPEIDAFVKMLDEKTRIAADQAGEHKYQ